MLLLIYTVELCYNDLCLGDTSAVVLHILWHKLKELCYNDLCLGDTSAVVLHILWHKLIPHKACVFLPCLI